MNTNLTNLRKHPWLLLILTVILCITLLAACSPRESDEEIEEEDSFTPAISLEDARIVIQMAFDYGEPGKHLPQLVDPEYIVNDVPYYQFSLLVDEEELESYVMINLFNGRLYSMDAEGNILPLNRDPYFIPYLTDDVDFGIDVGDGDEDSEDHNEETPQLPGDFDDMGENSDVEDSSTDSKPEDESELQDGE